MVSMQTSLEEDAIQGLRFNVRGELLQPGDAGYDAARTVYNAMVDRRPALIVRCTGVADVIAAVRFAREHDLPVAIRGGGHNVAGNCLCDDGLVIDLSRLKGIRVDPANRLVRAEGGVTWGELDRETQQFGLATTGGTISTTGIAGLTLGGGVGWLMRQYGLACDNLLSVDIVTADGRYITASATENPDLFWGMRGAGANFGVATSFEYHLHPVGQMYGGMLVYPMEKAPEVLRLYRVVCEEAPDELEVFAGLFTLPDGRPAVALVPGYNGPPTNGEKLVRPFRELGPLADSVGPIGYCRIQALLDEAFPAGLHNYWKSTFLRGLGDDAIGSLIAHHAKAASPLWFTGLEQYGGAVRRVGRDETSFGYRDGNYNLLIVARWTDPAEAETQIGLARDFYRAMQPYATEAVYVNYLEAGAEGAGRIKEAYGDSYERLVTLKNKFDPTNFFRINQNIRPTQK
jgi:FAD/FMN-containing dehydrogenase